MNTDDNEKTLAQKAMIPPGEYIKAIDPANEFVRFIQYVRPPVKRVKGFDMGRQRADHRKAQRAKKHQRNMVRNR